MKNKNHPLFFEVFCCLALVSALVLPTFAWAGSQEPMVTLEDYKPTVKTPRMLADKGDAQAQFALGRAAFYGEGDTPQDFAEALKWMQLAAVQGHAGAQGFIGLMCETGHGVPKDYVHAYQWLTLAADGFPQPDPGRRDAALGARDVVAAKMTAAEIAAAQKLVGDWRPAP